MTYSADLVVDSSLEVEKRPHGGLAKNKKTFQKFKPEYSETFQFVTASIAGPHHARFSDA